MADGMVKHPERSAARGAATLLTSAQFGALAEVLTELEWLASLHAWSLTISE
jgi:hypothetical protein